MENHLLSYFGCFRKLIFFRGIPFRSVPFRVTEWTLPRHSESHGMSTLFRGITKTVPSLFRGIFSEQNFDGNPNLSCPVRNGCPIIAILFRLSCRGCRVVLDLDWLSCPVMAFIWYVYVLLWLCWLCQGIPRNETLNLTNSVFRGNNNKFVLLLPRHFYPVQENQKSFFTLPSRIVFVTGVVNH
jgi:hypothetical protein